MEQLDALLQDLQAALTAKHIPDATTESDPVQMVLANADMETASDV